MTPLEPLTTRDDPTGSVPDESDLPAAPVPPPAVDDDPDDEGEAPA